MITLKPAALLPQSGGKTGVPVLATIIFNTLLPLFFILFAWSHAEALIQMLRISILLMLAKAVLEVRFYTRNSTAPFVRTSFHAWLIGLGGTIAPLMFRPNVGVQDIFVGTLIQAIGLGVLIYLFLKLYRGAGEPEAQCAAPRDGLYRFVRHPLTLAFILCHFGYVMNHTTLFNVIILACVTALQVARINEEERLLEDDTPYQEYIFETRWKLIPGMF